MRERNHMKTLEEKLGYTFQNRALLENALTHSSCANESRGKLQSNERLEFLGDSILGMVVADHLYRNHPDLPEGVLTRTRAALVCEDSLVVVAEELGLGASGAASVVSVFNTIGIIIGGFFFGTLYGKLQRWVFPVWCTICCRISSPCWC